MPRLAKGILQSLPLVLLGVVLWREKPWQVHITPALPWAMVGTLALNFGVYLPIKAARFRVALTDPPRFRQVLAATMEGLLANAAIGFGSGDVLRSARLRGGAGSLAADYACAWAERGAELLALAGLVFIAALTMRLGRLALVFSVLVATAYLAVVLAGGRLVPRLGAWPRLQHALRSGLAASTPKRVATMVGWSLAGWGSELVMLVLFQLAFRMPPSARVGLLTLVGINAAIVIPTLPGNFGTFEAGAIMALVAGGAAHNVAVMYALTYHLTHVVPVALVATAVYLVRSRRSSRAVRSDSGGGAATREPSEG